MSKDKCILMTGGAGFVGSHTVIEILAAGYSVVVIDNFVNSCMGKYNYLLLLEGVVKIQIDYSVWNHLISHW